MEKMPTRWGLDEDDFCQVSFCENCESSETHWHSHHLLTLYTQGDGILNINGVDHEISAGDLVVLSNTDFHRHTVEEGSNLSFYSIKFHYDHCSAEVRGHIRLDRLPICAHLGEEHLNLAKSLALYAYNAHKKATDIGHCRIACRLVIDQLLVMAYEYRRSSGVANLFSQLSSPAQIAELHSASKQIYQAVCYIQEHFRNPSLKVSDVSAAVGYTEHYFSETFKKFFSCPCKLYIQKCRLEFARRLILTRTLSITQICYEAGFKDLSYFISSFKRMYGVSPGKYLETQP